MKETLDVLVLIRLLAHEIEEAKSDGVLNWFDLPSLLPIRDAMKEAIKGSHLIPGELMHLSGEELKTLTATLIESIQKLLASFSK